MRIAKHAVLKAELGSFLVHTVNERLDACFGIRCVSALGGKPLRADGLCDSLRSIVAGHDEERFHRIRHRHSIALDELRRGFADRSCFGGYGYRCIRRVIERHDCGHDLRNGSDLRFGVGIAFEIDGAVFVHEQRVARHDVRAVRNRKTARFDRLAEHDVRIADFREGRDGERAHRQSGGKAAGDHSAYGLASTREKECAH